MEGAEFGENQGVSAMASVWFNSRDCKDTGGAKTWLMYGVAALLCLMFFGACGGKKGAAKSRGGSGNSEQSSGGKLRSIYEGCPRGASDEYKEGWAKAIEYAYGTHDVLLDVRRRINAGVLVEKHLADQMKTANEWIDNHLEWLREAAAGTGQESLRGEIDGFEYARRRIIKSRY